MKLAFIFIVLVGLTQSARCEELRHSVSAGYGVPNLPLLFFNYLGDEKEYTAVGTGPLHLKYENRINSWFGLGLSVNHVTYNITYKRDYLDTSVGKIVPNKISVFANNTAFNLRSNFHLINPEKNDKMDIYLGFGIGYRTGKLKTDAEFPDGAPTIKLPNLSKLGLETTAGMRYFIDNNIGLYLELGIAKSLAQFGFTARF